MTLQHTVWEWIVAGHAQISNSLIAAAYNDKHIT